MVVVCGPIDQQTTHQPSVAILEDILNIIRSIVCISLVVMHKAFFSLVNKTIASIV